MQKAFNHIGIFMSITAIILLIIISYTNGSIFLDRILLCSFIFGAAFLASKRNGLQGIDSKQENK